MLCPDLLLVAAKAGCRIVGGEWSLAEGEVMRSTPGPIIMSIALIS